MQVRSADSPVIVFASLEVLMHQRKISLEMCETLIQSLPSVPSNQVYKISISSPLLSF